MGAGASSPLATAGAAAVAPASSSSSSRLPPAVYTKSGQFGNQLNLSPSLQIAKEAAAVRDGVRPAIEGEEISL